MSSFRKEKSILQQMGVFFTYIDPIKKSTIHGAVNIQSSPGWYGYRNSPQSFRGFLLLLRN